MVGSRLNDPVTEVARMLVMRENKAFPEELKPELADLATGCDRLKPGDGAGWLACYRDLLTFANKAADVLDARAADLCQARPDEQVGCRRDPVAAVRRFRLDLHDVDEKAVSWVQSTRLPEQRKGQIRETLDLIESSLEYTESVDDGELVVQVEPARLAAFQAQAESVLRQWKELALAGLIARMNKHRAPILEDIDDDLRGLDVEYPAPQPVSTAIPSLPRIQASASFKLTSWPVLAWNFFRSGLGMVSMMAGVIGAVILVGAGGGGSSMGKRALLVVWAIPLLLVAALIYAAHARKTEKRKVRARVQAELAKNLQNWKKESADLVLQDIQNAVKKIKSESDQASHGFWLKLERLQRNRNVESGFLAPAADGVGESASVNQIRALVERIRNQIIPGITKRIGQLSA